MVDNSVASPHITRPLTTGYVARYYDLTTNAVKKWILAGKLKARQTPGGHWRIERSDFALFLNDHPVPGVGADTRRTTVKRPAGVFGPFLTTGEAGRYCDVSANAIKKWIRQGRLTAFRTPGGHVRIERYVFKKFLSSYGLVVDPMCFGEEAPKVETATR